MSFKATVINVMIASPSDVPGERQTVRDVLYDWNAIHADERKTVLLPVGWETHSAPDMGGPPQSIINKQLLSDCDILVGIFWTRIGTPTAEYLSGAVEEIERHIATGKPAMLYFSEAPVSADKIVDKQYKQLQKFKKSCQKRALYEGFGSVAEFKSKFSHQLQIKLKDYFGDSIQTSNAPTEAAALEEKSVTLSTDEQMLLKTASLDSRGIIHRIRVNAGTYIETHKTHFIKSQSPREIAHWDGVLKTLVRKGMIRAVGFKGDVFEVTAEGFTVSDTIDI